MDKQVLERGYRKAEEKEAKRRSKQAFDDGLMNAKNTLMRIESHAAGLSMKKLAKLETIIKKIESLQNSR